MESEMSDVVLKRINDIEKILIEINAKIDNFIGYEELTEKERRELRKIREEVKRGEYVSFDEVF
ncbi:MAG: hypothetical protein DSO07_01985 [Thermoproteota archaeon]|jgi:hypothetical protein|uniref:Uncharacterized protein n=1 Tax=Candidatus Methanodesulfokora washburnensis TaxID=2478471 RepID=A0A429GRS2_9CREN|nr:hypothetical protein [Candidatus Methanodesulfokores washburnensis]RSN76494.1 hypothetical protein D6D85_03875 [Candidatus Methanodesulfokores washburnensis]TDA41927.1 MAG: hypothetical protein DSO07_01985 [Candidatus Korarchaeota archaeon]